MLQSLNRTQSSIQYGVTEAKGQITEALNLLLEYESKKEPATKNQLLQLISNK